MTIQQFARLSTIIESRYDHTLRVVRSGATVSVVPALRDVTAEAAGFTDDGRDLRTIHQAVRAAKAVYDSMTQI